MDLPFWIFCVNGIRHYVAFGDWLLSLGFHTVLRLRQVVEYVSASFLWTAKEQSTSWMAHVFFLPFFLSLDHTARLARSQFLDQGMNWGHNSESLES